MNILLLTTAPKKRHKMNRDIILQLRDWGHKVYVACPADDENPVSDRFAGKEEQYLFISLGDSVGKIGMVRKVKNFLLTDVRYKKALKAALNGISVDLILYATPPITLANTIAWVKKRCGAKTYLMLKDIFPQNAVDMGMMSKSGMGGLAWRHFRRKEKKLYAASDVIGCMSPANCRYVLRENPEIAQEKVSICVNAYVKTPVLEIDEAAVRQEFGLPLDKQVFLYGGNLGKPQGLDYLVRVLRENKDKDDRFFVICGSGNDEKTIAAFMEEEKPANVLFRKPLPPDDFDRLSRACDVGLVFLDHRFTIPNFPSRMLSIMLNEKPILAATDKNTDVGEVIADGDMGWWCESTDTAPFNAFVEQICADPAMAAEKGKNARRYYEEHYTTEIACNQVLDGVSRIKG